METVAALIGQVPSLLRLLPFEEVVMARAGDAAGARAGAGAGRQAPCGAFRETPCQAGPERVKRHFCWKEPPAGPGPSLSPGPPV